MDILCKRIYLSKKLRWGGVKILFELPNERTLIVVATGIGEAGEFVESARLQQMKRFGKLH